MENFQEEFKRNGFLVQRALLPDSAIKQVLKDFHLIFTQKLDQLGLPVDEGSDNLALRNNMGTLLSHDKDIYLSALRLASRLQSIYAMMMHAQILEVLKSLNIVTLVVSGGVAAHVVSEELRIPGGYLGWSPHQDWTAGQGSLKHITVWAPLMDITNDFYPLKLIPGSHRAGVWKANRDKSISRGALIEIESDQYSEADWVSPELQRGDVVFMSGFTVHTTGAGTRSGVRIACGIRYEDISEPTFISRGYPTAFQGAVATQKKLHPGFPKQSDIDALFR